ncbi:hypothetical protein [Halomicrobium salinisoli]|nr:hypothetical protein [Halomicrobium salinisoli]
MAATGTAVPTATATLRNAAHWASTDRSEVVAVHALDPLWKA